MGISGTSVLRRAQFNTVDCNTAAFDQVINGTLVALDILDALDDDVPNN